MNLSKIRPFKLLQVIGPALGIGGICLLFFSMESSTISNKLVSNSSELEDLTEIEPQELKSLKKILLWNEFSGHSDFKFGLNRDPFLQAGCEVDTCLTTTNARRFLPEEFDAVVWHFSSEDKSLPDKRAPNTKYVFFLIDSPEDLNGNLREFNGVFNWTFTYRSNSDIHAPYGSFIKHNKWMYPPSVDLNSKTKLVAWFASKCDTNSKREKLVEALQKHIQVDIYGPCGTLKCDQEDKKCKEMIEKEYKFYLSFESSFCQDYVTENYFGILPYNIVPIVYGGAPYKTISPPNSSINVLDFENVEALANYLKHLDAQNEEYLEYLQWKNHYKAVQGKNPSPWCDLCKLLHSDTGTGVYKDLDSWYASDSMCKRPTIGEDGEFLLNLSLS